MKKIKSKLIAAVAAAFILMPAVSAYAETAPQSGSTSNFLQKQQQRIQKLQQKQQMSPALSEKKAVIKSNHETNSALRAEIKQKRSDIKAIYKDISQNNKTISDEDLAKINDQLEVIQAQIDKLASTKGTIKKEADLVKEAVKNGNLDEALLHLDNIISIQNTKTDYLKSLNTELADYISILKTASENGTPAQQTDTQEKL